MPVRQLYEAITEVLNNISPDNNNITGDFNINWLVETDRRPLYNLLLRDNHYKQFISTYTTDNNTVIDHIYTNISNIDIQADVLAQIIKLFGPHFTVSSNKLLYHDVHCF